MAALSTEPAAPEVTALPHRADVLAMVAGAALLSCTSIFVVLAQVPPAVSAFYRMLFGGVALLGWVALTGRWRPLAWRDVALALLPSLGLAADLILWHRSILWVGPGVATLLTNLQVFLLAVAGVLVYRERLARGFWPGMALALVGLWLLVGAHWLLFDARHRLGIWLGLASCLAYTVYLLSFRRALTGRTALSRRVSCAVAHACAGRGSMPVRCRTSSLSSRSRSAMPARTSAPKVPIEAANSLSAVLTLPAIPAGVLALAVAVTFRVMATPAATPRPNQNSRLICADPPGVSASRWPRCPSSSCRAPVSPE